MLEAIHTGDADTYAELSTPDLSCYEDVCAYRIDGLEFHLALIRQMAQNPALRPTRFDMLTPRVQVYGDTGIVTYTRLMTYDERGETPLDHLQRNPRVRQAGGRVANGAFSPLSDVRGEAEASLKRYEISSPPKEQGQSRSEALAGAGRRPTAAKDAYDFLGLARRAKLALANAVIYVATAPKSNARL